MSRYQSISYLLLVMFLVFFCTVSLFSGRFHGTLLILRIDDSHRVYWNFVRDLPKLFPCDTNLKIPETPYVNFGGMHDFIHKQIADHRKLELIVTPHPQSHYMATVNIRDIIRLVESDINRKRAGKLGVPLDSLPSNKTFHLMHQFYRWENRDTRIMKKAYAANNMKPLFKIPISEEDTFQWRYDHGYWETRDDSLVLYPPIIMQDKSIDSDIIIP